MDNNELHNQKEVIAMELYKETFIHHTKTGEDSYQCNRLANKALEEFNKTFEYLDSIDGD